MSALPLPSTASTAGRTGTASLPPCDPSWPVEQLAAWNVQARQALTRLLAETEGDLLPEAEWAPLQPSYGTPWTWRPGSSGHVPSAEHPWRSQPVHVTPPREGRPARQTPPVKRAGPPVATPAAGRQPRRATSTPSATGTYRTYRTSEAYRERKRRSNRERNQRRRDALYAQGLTARGTVPVAADRGARGGPR